MLKGGAQHCPVDDTAPHTAPPREMWEVIVVEPCAGSCTLNLSENIAPVRPGSTFW